MKIKQILALCISAALTNINIPVRANEDNQIDSYALSVIPSYIYANGLVNENNYLSDGFAVYDLDAGVTEHYIYFLLSGTDAIARLDVYDGEEQHSCFSLMEDANICVGDELQIYLNDGGLFCRTEDEDIFLAGENSVGCEDVNLEIDGQELTAKYPLELSGTSRSVRAYNIPLQYVANAATSSGAGLCWAACIASRANYEKGFQLTASNVYSAACASSAPGKPSGVPYGTVEWIRYTYSIMGISTTYTSVGKTKNEVASIVANQKPILCCIYRTEGERDIGHGVLLKGYYIDDSVCVYFFMDPNCKSDVTVVVDSDAQSNSSILVYSNGYQEYDNWRTSIY